ncbi:MAG: choice-of-anchor H family protein [Woeseia sp.]
MTAKEGIYFGIGTAILFFSAASTVIAADDVAVAPDETGEVRVSRSLRNPERIREQYSKLEKQQDRYKALALKGMRSSPAGQQSAGNDFWFYTADVVLFNDDDFDGFYWGIDLLFDADTYYDAADVYAVAYLSFEGGPWNEYAVTDTFTIFGATSDDEYVLVTELMSGYPTGYYDILIELFDAYDGAFLASFGPGDTSELSLLPLEDFNRDDPLFDVPVVVSHGGGGSADWWLLSAMLLLWLGITLRNDRKRRQEAEIRWRKLD